MLVFDKKNVGKSFFTLIDFWPYPGFMNFQWRDSLLERYEFTVLWYIFDFWAGYSDFLEIWYRFYTFVFSSTIFNPEEKVLLLITVSSREMVARNFYIKYVILPYLWPAEFTFEGAI